MRGRRIPKLALMRLHAERIALNPMARGAHLDWSAWWVEVYDASGRAVLFKAFAAARRDRPISQDREDAA